MRRSEPRCARFCTPPEHCDLAVAQVWARVLDNGTYLCSQATMHRILRAAGEGQDRRGQRTHPAKKIPELMARQPNEVWSWDITKLKGPARRIYYDLYVVLDIYSRYVVNWLLATHEDAKLAKAFLDRRHCPTRGQCQPADDPRNTAAGRCVPSPSASYSSTSA